MAYFCIYTLSFADQTVTNFYFIIMKVDQQLISRLEHLARLELTDAEREKLETDLNNILEMVAQLQSLDTTGIEPLVYINEEEQGRERADETGPQLNTAQALRNAPDHDENFFKVPKMIDL